MNEMKAHEQKYKDGDDLTPAQAVEVISENSGKQLDYRYLGKLRQQDKLHPTRKVGNAFLYPYSEAKNIVVGGHESSGRKPMPDSEASKSALYIREYKRRIAAKKRLLVDPPQPYDPTSKE